jgi:hypothetical protein
MAIETVKTYAAQSDQNDTVVYVGEGINGGETAVASGRCGGEAANVV